MSDIFTIHDFENEQQWLNDKMKALELLGKHLGMFKDKLEVDADMDLNITIDYGDNDNEES